MKFTPLKSRAMPPADKLPLRLPGLSREAVAEFLGKKFPFSKGLLAERLWWWRIFSEPGQHAFSERSLPNHSFAVLREQFREQFLKMSPPERVILIKRLRDAELIMRIHGGPVYRPSHEWAGALPARASLLSNFCVPSIRKLAPPVTKAQAKAFHADVKPPELSGIVPPGMNLIAESRVSKETPGRDGDTVKTSYRFVKEAVTDPAAIIFNEDRAARFKWLDLTGVRIDVTQEPMYQRQIEELAAEHRRKYGLHLIVIKGAQNENDSRLLNPDQWGSIFTCVEAIDIDTLTGSVGRAKQQKENRSARRNADREVNKVKNNEELCGLWKRASAPVAREERPPQPTESTGLAPVGNPFSPGESFNLTAQSVLIKYSPARAKQLAAQAGIKL